MATALDQLSKKRQWITGIIFVLILSSAVFMLSFDHILASSSSIFWNKSSSFDRQPAAFVITVPGHDKRVPTVMALFKKYANLVLHPYYGINGNEIYPEEKIQALTRPYYDTNRRQMHRGKKLRPLTPGERGLRETMKQFFKMVLNENYSEVFVFEDDAIPHINFSTLFRQLPNRCHEADVLLLGATMNRPQKYWTSDSCFHVNETTFGAFALLIKKSAFSPIIEWLESGKLRAFDYIYGNLRQRGFIVRLAYPPFLVIPDVSHSSLVDKNRTIDRYNITSRAKLHDWHFANYPIATFEGESIDRKTN